MTVPEKVTCSVLLAQLGCRQRFGWKAVPVVAVAAIAPDVDLVTKLISEPLFRRLQHALGHSLLSIVAAYVHLRCVLPQPTGFWNYVAGGWMYLAPQKTPVLDWR